MCLLQPWRRSRPQVLQPSRLRLQRLRALLLHQRKNPEFFQIATCFKVPRRKARDFLP